MPEMPTRFGKIFIKIISHLCEIIERWKIRAYRIFLIAKFFGLYTFLIIGKISTRYRVNNEYTDGKWMDGRATHALKSVKPKRVWFHRNFRKLAGRGWRDTDFPLNKVFGKKQESWLLIWNDLTDKLESYALNALHRPLLLFCACSFDGKNMRQSKFDFAVSSFNWQKFTRFRSFSFAVYGKLRKIAAWAFGLGISFCTPSKWVCTLRITIIKWHLSAFVCF